jgi:DNA invertase Pin-like site-specific DNA recombinase
VAVATAVERAVEQSGARVVCADGAGNGSSPADAFLRTILDAASAFERELIRARTSAALQAKKARGERAGTVPWGYTADADGRLVVNPAEQAVTARVQALRAAGQSLRAIVRDLEASGVVGRTGRPLALRQVANVARATV